MEHGKSVSIVWQRANVRDWLSTGPRRPPREMNTRRHSGTVPRHVRELRLTSASSSGVQNHGEWPAEVLSPFPIGASITAMIPTGVRRSMRLHRRPGRTSRVLVHVSETSRRTGRQDVTVNLIRRFLVR